MYFQLNLIYNKTPAYIIFKFLGWLFDWGFGEYIYFWLRVAVTIAKG